MNTRLIAMLFGFALLLAGCASKSQFVPATSEMDQAFRYTEHDRTGHDQPLSVSAHKQTDANQTEPAEVVPRRALVDMDSIIQIKVLRDQLGSERNGDFLDDDSGLAGRKTRIVQALNKVGPVVEAQQAAIEAYASENDQEFVRLRQAFGDKAYELLVIMIGDDEVEPPIIGLWPDGHTERPRLNELTNKYKTYAGIRRFLNEQLLAIEKGDGALAEKATKESISLRLEAWLESPGKESVPIHIDRYDDLDRGEIQRRDRFGMALTEEEIAQLRSNFRQTQEVAAAANAVLDKDKTVGEALLDVAPTLSRELGEIAVLGKGLAERFEADEVKKRLKRIQDAATNLAEAIEEEAQTLSENTLATWPAELADELRKKIEAPGDIIAAVERVTSLRDDWRRVNATNLSQRIDNTLWLFRDLKTDFNFAELPAVGEQLSENLVRFFEKKEAELTDEAKTTLTKLATGEPAKALTKEIELLYNDIQQVQTIGLRIRDLLEPAKVTLTERAHVPEVRKVPIDDVQDTFIELRRTGRTVGDTVTVEATRFETEQDKERETGTTIASFEVGRFGWYAELSPAVVLVEPTKLASNNDGFRFAPTLSWMAHYAPAPYKTGVNADTWRALRPGIGIHAAFLNFDLEDNQSIQIGLGATISLWENRLQFGAGYNLMSESRDDGRYYVFIGSDLIGILQSMGLTNP